MNCFWLSVNPVELCKRRNLFLNLSGVQVQFRGQFVDGLRFIEYLEDLKPVIVNGYGGSVSRVIRRGSVG